ncbi:hypothetical protein DOY81_010282 [Sarcophaga bullata]|nr:hypothetical protein DOY81_010282 [Sarcophaga bullata]
MTLVPAFAIQGRSAIYWDIFLSMRRLPADFNPGSFHKRGERTRTLNATPFSMITSSGYIHPSLPPTAPPIAPAAAVVPLQLSPPVPPPLRIILNGLFFINLRDNHSHRIQTKVARLIEIFCRNKFENFNTKYIKEILQLLKRIRINDTSSSKYRRNIFEMLKDLPHSAQTWPRGPCVAECLRMAEWLRNSLLQSRNVQRKTVTVPEAHVVVYEGVDGDEDDDGVVAKLTLVVTLSLTVSTSSSTMSPVNGSVTVLTFKQDGNHLSEDPIFKS